jgi:hypothetical protein
MTTIADTRNRRNSSTAKLPDTIDKSTNVRARIPHAAKKAHDGEAFFLISSLARTTGQFATILFQTPNTTTRVHFTAVVNSSGSSVATRLVEGVTDTIEEPSAFYNVRRESANTAETVWTFSSVAATGGTAIVTATVPYTGPRSGFRIGGLVEDNNERAEIVLKPNTKYALEMEALGDTTINYALEFYEHIDNL